MNASNHKNMKFIQVNICGLSDRSSLPLSKYVSDLQADVVFLSETKSVEIVNFPNYNMVLKPHSIAPKRKGWGWPHGT